MIVSVRLQNIFSSWILISNINELNFVSDDIGVKKISAEFVM